MIAWFITSMIVSTTAKELSTLFPHPGTNITLTKCDTAVTLALIQQLSKITFSFATFVVSSRKKKSDSPDSLRKWQLVLILGIVRLCGKLLNQFATLYSTVSFLNTVTVVGPIWTLVVAYFLIGESPTYLIVFSLVPMMLGVALSSATELSFTLIGFLSALFATGCFSLGNVLTKKILSENILDKVQLVLYTDLIGLVLMAAVFFSLEGISVIADIFHLKFIFLLIFHSSVNYSNTLLTFQIISQVTALSYSVLNVFKRVLNIVGSIMYFKNEVSSANIFGMALAFSATLAYAVLKQNTGSNKDYSADF